MTNAGVPASWTWGSSVRMTLRVDPTASPSATSAQLAQVSLPEPAVCTVYIRANVVRSSTPDAQIEYFAVNLTEGLGRTAVPRSLVFASQPALDAPLDYTLPWVPVHALQAQVEARAFPGATAELELEVFFLLSPMTRIPLPPVQPLNLGMALPGEADALDDELREDLESEAPSIEQIMAAREVPDDYEDEVEGDEGDEGDEPSASDARRQLIRDLIQQLAKRYGRKPTHEELREAFARVIARRRRRGHGR